MKKESKKYVIGVDGGGTKTISALADLDGNILKTVKTGPASCRNVGIEKTVENVSKGINKVFKKGVVSIYIGLPAIQEEYREKVKELEKKISKNTKIDVTIGSDQLVALRSGTDENTGVLLIAGTGSVAHGWRGGREEKVSGWGWLADEGSAIFVGQEVLRAVLKDMDGRGSKTKISKAVLSYFKVSTPEKLVQKVYKDNFLANISYLSILADEEAKKGDIIAREILRTAGDEGALSVNTVIRKLGLKNKKFPLVLVGSMFKSESFLKTIRLYIKETCSRAKIILPKDPPVLGAVRLAIENIK